MSRFNSTPESRELELRRQADAGDMTAKRTLEAREARSAADLAVGKLADRARSGDTAAMAKLREIATGKAAAIAPTAGTSASMPAWAVEKAATGRERDRWAKVFRSSAARGREQGCVNLLTAEQSWSADQILANLAGMPTDADREAKSRRAELDAAGERWERARRASAEGPSTHRAPERAENAPASTATSPMEKAWANLNRERRA